MPRSLPLTALFLLLSAAPAEPQTPVWPRLSDYKLTRVVHDGLHSVASIGVAEGLRLFKFDEDTRYLVGTVGLPLAQELYDYIYWNGVRHVGFEWSQPLNDIVTYQLPWAYYLARRGKWWQALYVAALYTGFLYTRYYGDWSDAQRFTLVGTLSLPLLVSFQLEK